MSKRRSCDLPPRKSKERKFELGYYMIFTDTEETEKNYILGLKDSLPEKLKDNISIKVEKLKLKGIVEYINKEIALNPQYSEPWIVFDRDKVVNFDKIIEDAEASGISVGWSNPCIEIWFSAYFGKMPNLEESTKCCTAFSKLYELKTNKKYKKSDHGIYNFLKKYGDEKKAISLAETRLKEQKELNNKPSKMLSTTTVHKLVKDIIDKVESKKELD